MRVTVLGGSGMLGHVVARYLAEAGHSVHAPDHRFDPASQSGFIESLHATQPEAVVNCIGIRAGSKPEALFDTHVRLVERSVECLQGSDPRFIQASTDGIFRPDITERRIEEAGDSTDDYGRSKWEAEQRVLSAGGLVVRCSILGPELRGPRSLMSWVLSQPGPVRGYVNHWWNGITTLQWARVCQGLLEAHTPEPIYQPGFWPPIPKAEVLRLICKVWDHPIAILPEEAPRPVIRTLVPSLVCPPLESQLRELLRWHGSRFPAVSTEGP